MREINNIKIIGVDAGYGNIKTANTVTPTGITACETQPIFNGSILEYEGKYYRIGEGHKEFIADKVTDDDFYLLTLMAIAKELNICGIRQADVYLVAGLPMTWIRNQRDSFREYLLRNEQVAFRFNGKDYMIRFVGCSVYPQGYPAIVNQLGAFNGINLLADIRTGGCKPGGFASPLRGPRRSNWNSSGAPTHEHPLPQRQKADGELLLDGEAGREVENPKGFPSRPKAGTRRFNPTD